MVTGGYICSVLPPSADFSGLSSEGVPGEGPHAGQAMGRFYVQALEGPSGDPVRGAVPRATVPKLWHAHAWDEVDTSPKDGQVQLGNGDDTVEVGRGAISEGGR